MFGSKSLNVPFIFKCDPRPPVYVHCPQNKYAFLHIVCAIDQLGQKCIYVFDDPLDAEQTIGLINPISSSAPPPPRQVENPLLNQEPVYRPYIQYTLYVYAAVYQARISTPPFTLHTSLFTTLPVFTQIAVMCKSLCNS